MDFLAQNWWLVLLAVGSGLALAWPSLSGRTQGVGAAEAVRLMNHEKAVVIDVCEPAEFAAGHVVGARNLPVGQIEAGAKALPANKTLPLVVVCATGARAGRAAGLLAKLGHEKVVVLQGGLAAWREANLPTEKTA
ncbi:MAG: rhodanese-like domain-containing protein [Burkholderiales bacterium]|uniref:rhodanese-like domain-containing protein n=1 Tax=Inhella sp. TaxID=1921806 RepID=UPI001AC1CA7F|nr:rhodanese-like domain-containing protein [Burkholderiales bacterium]